MTDARVSTDTRTGHHIYHLTGWTGRHEVADLFLHWYEVLAELERLP